MQFSIPPKLITLSGGESAQQVKKLKRDTEAEMTRTAVKDLRHKLSYSWSDVRHGSAVTALRSTVGPIHVLTEAELAAIKSTAYDNGQRHGRQIAADKLAKLLRAAVEE